MDVSLRRLRAGEWLAAAGGVVLLVALFVPWYENPIGVEASGGDTRAVDELLNAYEAFSVIDILLTLLVPFALAVPVLQATQDAPNKPLGAAVLTVVFGALGAVLVLFRLIVVPDDFDLLVGGGIALLAAVSLTVGAWLSLAAERVRGLPPDIEPELRPTPAP